MRTENETPRYYSLTGDRENRPKQSATRSGNDPCARKVDATIPNMGAALSIKDKVLDLGKSLLPTGEFEDLQKKYTYLSNAYNSYYLSALNTMSALYSQRDAIKAKKIDPAIAGGLAQGAAGIGAGVYTAVKQDQRNKQIDEARSATSQQVHSANISESRAKTICEQCFYDVMAYVNAYPELESLYGQEQIKTMNKEKDRKELEKQENRVRNIATAITLMVLFFLAYNEVGIILSIVIGFISLFASYFIVWSIYIRFGINKGNDSKKNESKKT